MKTRLEPCDQQIREKNGNGKIGNGNNGNDKKGNGKNGNR